MGITPLKEIIREAEKKKVAIGHFNISDSEGFWAVVNAAKNLDLPIIIGVSEGESDFIGLKQIAALVQVTRSELNHPIYLNADHFYSVERVKEAIDAGFDAAIFDGAKLSLEDNISATKKCVEYAKEKFPQVLIEGEIGYIGTSSKILDEIPEGVTLESMTKPEDSERFVQETGVDMLAPSVGNIHGMFRYAKNPSLNIALIKEIRGLSGVPIVLHGGSGISDDDFLKAIDAGISVIHINTELRLAYKEAAKNSLETGEDIAPYKFMKGPVEEMTKLVEKKLKLFNKI